MLRRCLRDRQEPWPQHKEQRGQEQCRTDSRRADRAGELFD